MEHYFGLLRERIKTQYKTFGEFAEAIGVTPTTMSKMLTGKSDWTRERMVKAAEALGIKDDIQKYFF